jgi:hypothetical protein
MDVWYSLAFKKKSFTLKIRLEYEFNMPNKLFYTEVIMGGVKEYWVTLLAGEWSDYRAFASADEANRCILDLKHIKETPELCALEEFILYTVAGLARLGRLGSAPM